MLQDLQFEAMAGRLETGRARYITNERRSPELQQLQKHLSNQSCKQVTAEDNWQVDGAEARGRNQRHPSWFLRDRGTRDQVFALKIIVEKFREFHVDTSGIYLSFVDYEKAFDSVIHSKLWSTMRDMSFPGHIIGLLESLYENQESAVRTNVGTTDWFKVTKGVRQGCCLSPQLFNIYTGQIMRNVLGEGRYDAVSIGGRAISELRYADGTVLLSTSEQSLSRLLESNRHFSEEAGLLINTTKTKLMKLDRTPDMNDTTLDGKQLEEVTSFEYLGVRIQNNRDNFQEVRKRLSIGIQTLGRLKSLWRDTDITLG